MGKNKINEVMEEMLTDIDERGGYQIYYQSFIFYFFNKF